MQTLSSRDISTLKNLEALLDVSQNMSNYRHSFHKARSPAVPFFPLILKDVFFFIDGNKTQVDSPPTPSTPDQELPQEPSWAPIINFEKFRGLAKHLERTLSYTAESYSFTMQLEKFPFLSPLNQTSSALPPSSSVNPLPVVMSGQSVPLDYVADIVEARLRSIVGCIVHECESKLMLDLK